MDSESRTELSQQATVQAKGQLDAQKEQAAGQLNAIRSALHESSESFRRHDQGGLASTIDTIADRVERVTHSLRDKSIDELLHDVEDYARREPALFLGGGLLVGLLGARFLKAKRPRGGFDDFR